MGEKDVNVSFTDRNQSKMIRKILTFVACDNIDIFWRMSGQLHSANN